MGNHIRIIKDNIRKWLSEVNSPNEKFRIVMSESGNNEVYSVTTIMINSKGGGITVYDAFGINLNINAYWKNDNTVVIETKKGLNVLTIHSQVQFSNDVIEIELREE